jgi:UDPglucose 6-dehydrogenase
VVVLGFCQAPAPPRVTEWEQFRALDFLQLKKVMAKPVLVDLRNIYRPEQASQAGFEDQGIGRGA